jgi:hypothetical protein
MPGIWKWVLIKLICQKKTCTGEIYTTCIWFAKELGIGYDNFSCTILKLFMGLDKLGAKGRTKN